METQANREKNMTWQQIRDESISQIKQLKEIYGTVTSGYVEKEIQAERYRICEECSEFKKLTRQCTVCSCFMPAKTLFNKSKCPKGYWSK